MKTAGADGEACRAFLQTESLPGGAAYAALPEQITVEERALAVRLRGVPGMFRLQAEDWKRGIFSSCERVQDT